MLVYTYLKSKRKNNEMHKRNAHTHPEVFPCLSHPDSKNVSLNGIKKWY